MDRPATDEGPELLLVGLDAGCFSVIDPLVEAGSVPTLDRLLSAGVSASLESQIPPWTASAWPSLFTGMNPGKHGVFDFLAFEGYDWDVVNATHVRARPVWELLSDHGYTSVVVNVPVTHPAREFDGALIPGLTAPEDPTTHPESILEEIEREIGSYRIYPQSGPEPDRSIEGYRRTVECRGAAFRYLLEEFDPDFAFVQFQVTDSVFHERPGDEDAVRAVYEAVDREVERTLDEFAPGAVMLVSDHGIGPVTDVEFRVNDYLRDTGYLRAKRGGDGMPTWSRAFENDLLSGEDAGEHQPGPLERAVSIAARFGITTQRVANALDYVGLAEPIGRRLPSDAIRAGSEQVDFPASKAYVRSKSELGIRLNVERREPNGTVPPDRYESVRSRLVDELESLTTPAGDPVFESVGPREQFFSGPHVESGPDVVTVPRAFDTAIVARLTGDLFGEPIEPWNHKRDGLIAAVGDGFDEAPMDDAHLFDVAPTICAFFDVPVDEEMDGAPLPVVDRGTTRAYPAYDPGPTTTTDDRLVEDRLSDLGYL
ncbi:alkaline phosphatase family protein [Halovivax gelatinilyticus]|uniref:alkaline phosphatase family protein n=1 Tax=Halovivax gelatinilyticus TaxID=2961597 RepID=UPI0020CA7E7A|nr:alkaline phosphatase family protein [Halovivax gelatinilyticus]